MKNKFVCLILIVVLLSNLVILPTMASGGVSVGGGGAGGGAGVGVAKPSLSNGMPAKFEFVHCEYNDGKVTAQINFTYLKQSGMLYLALYNDNQLVALQNKLVAVDEPMNTIEIFNIDKNCKNYLVKAFYWDGDTLLTPLANLIEGKIESLSYARYGFIISAGQDVSVGDVTYQIRILDDEGNIVTYALANKVKYASAAANGVVTTGVSASAVYADISALAVNWNPLTTNTPANIDNYARRIITYRTNSNGDINEIRFAGARVNGKESYLTYNGVSDVKQSVTYNANTQSFVGAVAVDEDTIVFNLPMEANVVKEDFAIDTIESFNHKGVYDVAFLSIDENYVSKVMIVVNNKKQKPVEPEEPEEPAEPEPDLTPANYGFIISAGQDVSVGDVTYQIRILDDEGDIITYNLANKLRFADATANGVVASNVPAATVYAVIDSQKNGYSWNPLTANTPANIDNYARRIITYRTNSNGDINEIVFAGARVNGEESYLTYNGASDVKQSVTYNANTQSFVGAYAVEEETIVFNLPMEANVVKEDFAIDTIESFNHKGVYDVAFLLIDENYVSKVMIVVNNKKQKPVEPEEPEEPAEPEPDLTPANYGFIISAGQDVSVGDVTYQIRILDDEGDIITYNLANKLRFADATANGVVASNVPAATVYAVIDSQKNGYSWNPLTANTPANIDNYAKRIITYRTNSNGDINEIIFAGARVNGEESYLTYNGISDVKQSVTYNADTQLFADTFSVNKDTVVFYLPMKSNVVKEDFKIETVDFFLHEEEYDVAFLSVNADNVSKVVIVTNDIKVGHASKLAVVTKILSAQNAEKEDIYYLTFLQNGKLQTRSITAKLYKELNGCPWIGDVFEYSVDKYGSIDAIALGDAYGGVWNGSIDVVSNYPSYYDLNGDKVQYVFGIVKSKTNNGIIAIGDNWDRHAVSDNTNFYLVDFERAKTRVLVSSYDEIQASKVEVDPDTNSTIWSSDYVVFMKYYNEQITDVIIYKGVLTQGLIN